MPNCVQFLFRVFLPEVIRKRTTYTIIYENAGYSARTREKGSYLHPENINPPVPTQVLSVGHCTKEVLAACIITTSMALKVSKLENKFILGSI